MKYAAFFRNLNLGRANCPNKTQLEQAFVSAGAANASSFLTNGTVIFSIKSRTNPVKLLVAASKILEAECGLKEPGYVRSVNYLRELVDLDPFATVNRSGVDSFCVTFLHPSATAPPIVPLQSKTRNVEIFRFTHGEALSLSRKTGKTAGSPNDFLEKYFGLPATTRVWNTIVRIVKNH